MVAVAAVAALLLWPPPLDPFLRSGSPQLLFRGLIAGSLSRRLPLTWANVAQAVVFLLPHLFAVRVMPELLGILPIVFAGALFVGWVRIRSGSIVGPWIIHSSLNVVVCLSVAIRSAS